MKGSLHVDDLHRTDQHFCEADILFPHNLSVCPSWLEVYDVRGTPSWGSVLAPIPLFLSAGARPPVISESLPLG